MLRLLSEHWIASSHQHSLRKTLNDGKGFFFLEFQTTTRDISRDKFQVGRLSSADFRYHASLEEQRMNAVSLKHNCQRIQIR